MAVLLVPLLQLDVHFIGTAEASVGTGTEGRVYGWGRAYYLPLNETDITVKQKVPTLIHDPASPNTDWTQNFTSLAGKSGVCGVTNTGAGYCLGGPTATAVPGNHTWKMIAVGYGHKCGITTAGVAYCWGDNTYGELGNGTTTDSTNPVAVSGGLTFDSIDAGGQHSCGITTSGLLYCWGRNDLYQLGNNNENNQNNELTPTRVHDPDTPSSHWNTTILKVSLGPSHSCAIDSNSRAYCWGDSWNNNTATGTTSYPKVPKRIHSPNGSANWGASFIDIAAAGDHTCAIKTNGVAYCWGNDNYGSLGNLSFKNAEKQYPVRVSGNKTWLSISTGTWNTCAINDDKYMFCWGKNILGQLGNNTTSWSATPQRVHDPDNPTANWNAQWSVVAAGYQKAFGIRTGTAQTITFPAQSDIKLNAGPVTLGATASSGLTVTYASQTSNVCSVSGSTVTLLTAGTCTIVASQAGTDTIFEATPVSVSFTVLAGDQTIEFPNPGTKNTSDFTGSGLGLSAAASSKLVVSFSSSTTNVCTVSGILVTKVALGTCTITASQAGSSNFNAAPNVTRSFSIVDGAASGSAWEWDSTPAAMSTSLVFTSVEAGRNHSCGLTAAGTAYCWGENQNGELGNGFDGIASAPPVMVLGGHTWAQVRPGGNSTCGVTTNGQGYCWGNNDRGQLGDGSTAESLVPVPVAAGETWTTIDPGGAFACGVTTGGAGLCWGNNFYGNLGNGSKHNSTNVAQTSRTEISGGHSWSKIEATNGGFTCGITTSGVAYCWGTGSNGVLGNGSTPSVQDTPVAVSGGLSFSFLTGADSHICGLTTDGQAHCWGYDGFGQLGSGRAMDGGGTTGGYNTSIKSTTPQAVAGGHSFVSISTGNDFFSCGVATGGQTYCWGRNTRIGTGATDGLIGTSIPTAVGSNQPFHFVSSSYFNSLALAKRAQTITFPNPGDQTVLAAGSVPADYDKITDIAVGESPYEMTSASGYIYTVDQTSGTLSRIDAATNTMIETVNIGSSSDGSSFLAVHNDKVYITAISSDQVKLVDFSASPASVTTLSDSLIDDPRAIAVTDSHAYIVQYNGPTTGDDNLIRVDLSTNAVESCISSANLREGWEITTQGRYGYITHPNRNLITKVDLPTCTVIKELWDLTDPAINLVAHNNRLYTANYKDWGSGNGTTVDMIDLDTFSVIDTWTGFSGPQGMAVSGDRLFVSNVTTSAVSVRTLSNGNEVASVPIASTSRYVATSGSTLYVVSQATDEVSAFYIGAQAPGGVTLTGTSSSTLPVSYASTTTDMCTASGSEVSFVAGGTCTITASQAGNDIYDAAADVMQSFNVAKASQAITFNQPADDLLASGGTSLTGSASSGLPVSYASSTTNVCTVSGAGVTYVAFGICSINAYQAGNNSFEPAADVTRAFNICTAADDCDGDDASSDNDTNDLNPDVDGDGTNDGADNCPTLANAAQTDTDGDGLGNACDSDDDGDGVADGPDNCPLTSNADQTNTDSDGFGNACDTDDDGDGVLDGADNCPLTSNAEQTNTDSDGFGNACDADDDGDGVLDGADNCPLIANAGQTDIDGDGTGDACSDDNDGDGILDDADNCPVLSNADQTDTDSNGTGDACDADDDGDGVLDGADNCPLITNAGQTDTDGDGTGDACSDDNDGDGILDDADNCPLISNADQADNDSDGTGDACSDDNDGDGILDNTDNCPLVSNADQADSDSDGTGDACSDDADGDGTLDDGDNCPLLSNPEQIDTDSDGIGDLCDDDDDNDGVLDVDEVREDCRIKVDCDDDGETDLTDPFPLAVTEVSLDTGASIKTVPPDRLSTCSLLRSAAYLSPYTAPEGMESIGTQAHFSLSGCETDSPETISVEVNFGKALPAEGLVCKVEGTSEPVDMSGATIRGTSVTYTLTDNGQFDTNSAAGVIDDPVTVIVPNDTEAPTVAPAVPVPIRSFWLLLAGLLVPTMVWRNGQARRIGGIA